MIRLLLVSDLHVGSTKGLCLPEYTLANGQRIGYNKQQKRLYGIWEEMCDEYKHPDYILGNGDLIDGKNYIDEGVGCWSPDINEQSSMAKDLFLMTRARKYVALQGTKYHCGHNMSGDQLVVDKLQGDWKGISHLFDFEGVKMHVRHKISTANKRETEHGALARERATMITEYPTYGKIDIMVRSHRHSYCYCGKYGELDLVTPCFKAPDSFISEFTVKTPDIGYIYFEIKDGDYSFDPRIYKLEQEHVIEKTTYS